MSVVYKSLVLNQVNLKALCLLVVENCIYRGVV